MVRIAVSHVAQLETTAYYAFGVPLYAGLLVGEWWLARRRGRRALAFADSVGNIGAGLGSIVVGLFLGPMLIALYDFGYSHLALIHFAPGAWAPWVLAMVLADFGHYWHHRLDHRVAACWAVHGVHHQPVEMNFTVGMRHAWFSDLYSFVFYLPLPLLGVPTAHFFVATTLLSVHALLTHSAEYDFPGFGILVTPRSHIVHHARNPRYLDKNFGAMLAIWDRVFGTHVDLATDEPPVYGTVHGYETHDGARSQWVLWRELIRRARGARTVGDRFRVFFGRPSFVPPGVAAPTVKPPRASAAIPLAIKVWVAAQLVATSAFSLYIFILREDHSLALRIVSAVAIVASLRILGALLDGPSEKSRVPVTAAPAPRARSTALPPA